MASSQPVIRPVHPDDAPEIYEIIRDPRVNRTLLRVPSMEFAETEAWITRLTPGHHRLVAAQNGRILGSLSLRQNQNPRLMHSGEIGLMVHPDHWGHGVGSALLAAAVDLADNWLNLSRLQLEVFAGNVSARSLYERFGFEIEGRRRQAVFAEGRYEDELVMARLRGPVPAVKLVEPAAPPKRTDVVSLTLRPQHPGDAEELHAILSHPAVGRGTLQLPSQEIGRVHERLAQQEPGVHRLAAVATHEDGSTRVVGSASLRQSQNPRLRHKGSIGMGVHPEYWGIGAGKRLMEGLIDLGDNWLNLRRIELNVYSDNAAAIGLYEKFGFEVEGRRRMHSYGDGRWADTLFMARLRA